MRLTHPNLDPSTIVESDDEDYTSVLQRHGWVEAPALPALPELAAATVKDILAEVGDDPDLAAAAIEEERAGKNRKSLIRQLEQITAEGAVIPPISDRPPQSESAPNQIAGDPTVDGSPDPADDTSAEQTPDTEEPLA
jgi:hypothetical protein